MYIKKEASPCERCSRVTNPNPCENKYCKLWKSWFLRRWAAIHGYGKQCGLSGKRCGHEVEE